MLLRLGIVVSSPRSTAFFLSRSYSTASLFTKKELSLGINCRGFFRSTNKIQQLEHEANSFPQDVSKQLAFLKAANTIDPSIVVRRIDSQQYANNEATVKEYIKALVHMGRLDQARLSDLVGNASSALGAGGAVVVGTAGGTSTAGTNEDPVHIRIAEPTIKSQIWRTFRILIVGYAVVLFVMAILEDRGLTNRPSLSTGSLKHDLQPAKGQTKRFSDVVGVDEAKSELEEVVQFLKDPTKFTRLGGKMPKGVLLMGPPGTGKTILARAIAGEAGVPFFYASGSEFDEVYVGVGARRVRDLFEAAKKAAPCIIFIDEIDAIGASRNPKDQQYMRMTLNQLLADMDGFNSNEGIIVIGATNFPEVLDKALTRPGRFDRHIVIPNPDVEGRKKILELHLNGMPLSPNVDISVLARGTPGFSGADLANLVNIGALRASTMNKDQIAMDELEYAKDRIMMGAERKSAVITEKNRKLTAFHEGGHAVVAAFTPEATPLHKATIVPRGMALGMVTQLPEEDELNWTKKQMLAKLDVCMGGRVAEELIFGPDDVTSGASSDLDQATKLAKLMVERFGMSSKVGYMAIKENSPETKALVDQEVRELCNGAYERARKLLTSHNKELNRLAQALLDHETLTAEEIKAILNGDDLKKAKVKK